MACLFRALFSYLLAMKTATYEFLNPIYDLLKLDEHSTINVISHVEI